MPAKVLVLTAGIGGGHAAAGLDVCAKLEGAGYVVTVEDGLRVMSATLSRAVCSGYQRQARSMPWLLTPAFTFVSSRTGSRLIKACVGSLFAHRILAVVRGENPDVIVSTYPLVTATLGNPRADGRLSVPVAAVIPDYGVHALWVDPRIDLHLVASSFSAELAREAGGRARVVKRPVDPAFGSAPSRIHARDALRIPQQAYVAVVVGGALGIGDLETTARHAVNSGAYVLMVAGRNAKLQTRLEKKFENEDNVRVLGWVRDRPGLMASADCLIQNAGGMTCAEAVEIGLPILLFDPIPGHGEHNCAVVEREGAALWLRTPEKFEALLGSAVGGEVSLLHPRINAEDGIVTALDALQTAARSPHSHNSPARRIEGRLQTLAGREPPNKDTMDGEDA